MRRPAGATLARHGSAWDAAARLIVVLLWPFFHSPARGAGPQLDHIFPPAVAIGTTNLLTLSGKFDPWPPHIWCEDASLRLIVETNKGKVRIETDATVSPGARWIRLYNDAGASEPRFVLLTPEADLPEVEPNDWFSKPQVVTHLPAILSGRLGKSGDVDSFLVDLIQGQTLTAAVEAYTLGATLDALLHLVTADEGRELCWNHDAITLDPRLEWRATSNGPVVVQVMGFPYPATASVQLAGGDGCIYRLHLTTHQEEDGGGLRSSVPGGGQSSADRETSRTAKAIELQLWEEGSGCIRGPGETGRYRFHGEAGVPLAMEVWAARLGSPLDAWLAVEDAHGKELARNDDAGLTRDPLLLWTPPASGEYQMVIGNTLHRGGEDYAYRVTVRAVLPGFEAELTTSALLLAAGATNSLKVNVKRVGGLEHRLMARLVGAPEQVRCEPVEVPAKAGELAIELSAPPNAVAFSGPLEVLILDEVTSEDRPVPVRMTATKVDNGVPGGYTTLLRETVDTVWLTVTAPPPVVSK